MTIGPAPMIRMDFISVRLGISLRRSLPFFAFHHLDEAGEEVVAVLRAGRGFRVVLHREHRLVLQLQPAIGAVEQRDVGLLDDLGQAFAVDGEAVIHRGDLDLAGGEVLHRMVRAVMALMHLLRRAAEREAEHLMAEADAEHRQAESTSFLISGTA